MNESFELNKSPRKKKNKKEILGELESINKQLDKETHAIAGKIVFENSIKDNLEIPINEMLNLIRQTVLKNEFISVKYDDPLNKKLIETIIEKSINSTKDLSSNAWRTKLKELFNKNNDDEIAKFKSEVVKIVSNKIINRINDSLDSNTTT